MQTRINAWVAWLSALVFTFVCQAQLARACPTTTQLSAAIAGLDARVEAAQQRDELLRDRTLAAGPDAAPGERDDQLVALADCLLERRDPGFVRARAAGEPEFSAWLARVFSSASDARLLLSAATAYLAVPIGSGRLEVDTWIDVPMLKAMLRRSAELAPAQDGARALMQLGALDCALPPLVGGRPQAGISQLERAVALTRRENLAVQLTMAERCAVTSNDRSLFVRLLDEIAKAPVGVPYARGNEIAKQRAHHLLEHADVLFPD